MAPNKIIHETHNLLPFDLRHQSKNIITGSSMLSVHIVYDANSHLSYTAAVVPSSGRAYLPLRGSSSFRHLSKTNISESHFAPNQIIIQRRQHSCSSDPTSGLPTWEHSSVRCRQEPRQLLYYFWYRFLCYFERSRTGRSALQWMLIQHSQGPRLDLLYSKIRKIESHLF